MKASFPGTAGRRTFLRNFWAFAAASTVGGRPWTGLALAETVPGTGIMRLKVSDYPVLGEVGGSVRLTAGPLPPLVVNRASATTFHAMSVVCQHQGCFVPAYNPTLGCIQCPCHGSRYAIDGSLLEGPALKGLGRFETKFDGADKLEIQVPGLAFDLKAVALVPMNGSLQRLALTFPAAAFSEYRVYLRNDLSAEPVEVAFATAADGPANVTTLKPRATADVTVYVDATGDRALYSVGLVSGEYQG